MRQLDPADVYVFPGEVRSSATAVTLRTTLGSCVSVCLWDPVRRIGGMNHFVLPLRVDSQLASTRFGGEAIEELLRQVKALGADAARLQAKVFGGMCTTPLRNTSFDIGGKNVVLAHQWMETSSIPIVAEDVGGVRGRSVRFSTGDGDAWVRQL